MELHLHHALATVHIFITVICSKQLVYSDNFHKQLSECQDSTADCSAGHHEPRNIHLRLPRINGVKVGHIQEMELTEGAKHTVRTLSLQPPVFEIPNFFTDEECEMIIDLAQEKGMSEIPLTENNDNSGNEDLIEHKFKAWDKNEDEFIDKTEALHIPEKRNIYSTEDDVLEMFAALNLDQDEDGKLSMKELEQTSLEDLNAYFDKEKLAKPRLRSHNNQQVWLWHDEDELLQYEGLLEDYHDRLQQLTKLPKPIIEQSEPMQVVHYKEQGHYHCHHDSQSITHDKPCCMYGSSDCRLCRYLTIMVFLNDVDEGGECAFPLADNTTFSWQAWSNESVQRCNMVKHCDKSNLVIKPQRGKALLWYNHLYDGTRGWLGELDPLSYQGSCYVQKGDKWVAKIWININGDGDEELRVWKMGHNWLAKNNYNEEIVNALRSEIHQNKYARDINENIAVNIKNEHLSKEDAAITANEENTKSDVNEQSSRDTSDSDEEATVVSLDDVPELTPKSPKLARTETSTPLPLTEEQMTPKGPEIGHLPLKEFQGNRIVQSIMLLLEELDQVELEIIARNLHTKLKLVCVPLIMNPMGRI
ncbi:transmembrane prolyl 4-hydroxylase-like [Stylophora pistillata]|uniref:transmembrane prolyl 4-hydroxylase-like n=1 Tax=Stylophora pistillata TaxID=50429 RepID=UPI000C04A28C|nr:transmembrane prolyl 4-hydroxylase-like [Stylophora pistillata]